MRGRVSIMTSTGVPYAFFVELIGRNGITNLCFVGGKLHGNGIEALVIPLVIRL